MNGSAWWVLATFAVAAAVAALATPAVAKLAVALGVIDRPNERKVSKRANIPLLGGLAVALGFVSSLGVALFFAPDAKELQQPLEGLLVGAMLVLGLGAVDDRIAVGAWTKLVVQLAAAGAAIAGGFHIDHLTDPLSETVFVFPTWLSWSLTVVWIVIVTNSLNLIDGLDGLCTGVSAIIAATLTVIAWQGGHLPGVAIGVALLGALLGFLPYNFPPARIFVGDTGALFVGYCLAILALEGYQRVTVITFLVPLLALAVPLLDTGLSILRRLRQRKHIMQADRHHMHHRLLAEYRGSHRPAVLSIYFLTGCFCLIAVSFTRLQGYAAVAFLAVVGLLTLRILRNLGFLEGGEATSPATGGPQELENETR